MAQVIELSTARRRPNPPRAPDLRCRNCGADLWCITRTGEVRCADCEMPCPHRLLIKDES